MMKLYTFCYCIGYGGCSWELIKADTKEEAWDLLKKWLETEDGIQRYPIWRTGTKCNTLIETDNDKNIVKVLGPQFIEGDYPENTKNYWREGVKRSKDRLALNKQPTEEEIANDLFGHRPGEGFRLESEEEYLPGKGHVTGLGYWE